MNTGNSAVGDRVYGYFSFATGFRPCPVPTARRQPTFAIERRRNRAAFLRPQGGTGVAEAEVLEGEADTISRFVAKMAVPASQVLCGAN